MYSQVSANKRKTLILILLFIFIIGGMGWVFSQVQNTPAIFIGVLVFAVVYAWFSYYNSARMALWLTGAKPIAKKDAPALYRTVENLSITAGLPMPKVYIISDPAPNAFATGRDPKNAVVAVTSGLLEMLENEELEGVLAHELSHIGNYDIRLMAVVLALVTIVVYVSDFFMRITIWGRNSDNRQANAVAIGLAIGLAILAPIVAMLVQLAISRKREYLADASGTLLTRYPDGLASALKKIEGYKKPMRHANAATAHLFLANPLKDKRGGGFIAKLFSTHPPTAERIKRLQKMGREQ